MKLTFDYNDAVRLSNEEGKLSELCSSLGLPDIGEVETPEEIMALLSCAKGKWFTVVSHNDGFTSWVEMELNQKYEDEWFHLIMSLGKGVIPHILGLVQAVAAWFPELQSHFMKWFAPDLED